MGIYKGQFDLIILMDALKRVYHPDEGIDGFLVELIEDLERNRAGYQDGSRFHPPIGRVDLIGDNYRNDALDAIRSESERLGVVSIEEMGGSTVVMFGNGTRAYEIKLDDLANACKLPVHQLRP